MASLVNHANAKKKGKKESAYLIKAEYCSIETKAFSIYSLILFKSNVDKKNSTYKFCDNYSNCLLIHNEYPSMINKTEKAFSLLKVS